MNNFNWKKILLKISGESLMGEDSFGINPSVVKSFANEIAEVVKLGIQLCIVVGGGNIYRGISNTKNGVDRATGDYMGMLATVMNSLAIQNAMEQIGIQTRVQSALPISALCEQYIRRRAKRHMEKGRVVIFAAGTGNPYFTTDTAASLRAMEIGADVIFKATKVDGIYSSDPRTNKDAIKYKELSYLDVLKKELKVMDSTAVSLCMDNKLPMVIFNFRQAHSIKRVLLGEKIGTIVGA